MSSGDYRVYFDEVSGGDGFTSTNTGNDDGIDNDVWNSTGRTSAFSVGEGEAVTDVDAGVAGGKFGGEDPDSLHGDFNTDLISA